MEPVASRSNLLPRGDGLEDVNRPGGASTETNEEMECEASGGVEESPKEAAQPNQDPQTSNPNRRVKKIAVRRRTQDKNPKKEE